MNAGGDVESYAPLVFDRVEDGLIVVMILGEGRCWFVVMKRHDIETSKVLSL